MELLLARRVTPGLRRARTLVARVAPLTTEAAGYRPMTRPRHRRSGIVDAFQRPLWTEANPDPVRAPSSASQTSLTGRAHGAPRARTDAIARHGGSRSPDPEDPTAHLRRRIVLDGPIRDRPLTFTDVVPSRPGWDAPDRPRLPSPHARWVFDRGELPTATQASQGARRSSMVREVSYLVRGRSHRRPRPGVGSRDAPFHRFARQRAGP